MMATPATVPVAADGPAEHRSRPGGHLSTALAARLAAGTRSPVVEAGADAQGLHLARPRMRTVERFAGHRNSIALMAHHKRKGPKSTRAGCLLCKPSKHQANVGSDRRRAEQAWRRDWTANKA